MIEDLIEASSLGTPGAKRLRDRTPPEVARQLVARAKEIDAIRAELAKDPGFGEADETRRVVDIALRLGIDPQRVRQELDEINAEEAS